MNLIQAAFTLFFGAAILRVLLATRAGQICWRRSILWVLLWAGGLLVVWFPPLTVPVARWLGVKRGVDAILYLSIGVLSYLVFRLYVVVERQDQVISQIVSELALRDGDDPRS